MRKNVTALLSGILALVLLLSCVSCKEPINEDYRNWLGYAAACRDSIRAETIVTGDSNDLAWWSSYVIDAFLHGWRATGDDAYLTKAADFLYGIFLLAEDNDGDGFRNWGTEQYDESYTEYCCHSGTMVCMAADFMNLIAGDPSLADIVAPDCGKTLGEISDYLLDTVIHDIVPAFDVDFSEKYGVYMNRKGCSNFGGTKKELNLPHNQYLIMTYGLAEIAKLDIPEEQRVEYLRKSERMLQFFDKYVQRNGDGTIYWAYHNNMYEFINPALTGEDFSHAMWDMKTAACAQKNGVLFTDTDMEAFAETYLTTMRREKDGVPMLTYNVDGTGDETGYVFLMLYDLSVYDSGIWEMGRGYLDSTAAAPKGQIDSMRVMAYHPQAPKPEKFLLTSPADGEEDVNTGYAVFRWMNAVGATDYTLTITDDESGDTVLERKYINGTSAAVSDVLEEGKTYSWQVTAHNVSGKTQRGPKEKFKTGTSGN